MYRWILRSSFFSHCFEVHCCTSWRCSRRRRFLCEIPWFCRHYRATFTLLSTWFCGAITDRSLYKSEAVLLVGRDIRKTWLNAPLALCWTCCMCNFLVDILVVLVLEIEPYFSTKGLFGSSLAPRPNGSSVLTTKITNGTMFLWSSEVVGLVLSVFCVAG